MTSSSGRCPGKKLHGCCVEIKSASPLWLRHGHSRRLALDRADYISHTDLVSFSVLGWVPGIITMVVAGILFWITSITMHKFIMKNPQIKDICM